MITAMKFGGSILAKKEQLEKLAGIVKKRRQKEKVAIIASALKGVTDQLINAACKSLETSKGLDKEIANAKEKHLEMLKGVKDKSIRAKAGEKLKGEFSVLERSLYGIAYLKELSPRSLDIVQTTGERMSILLLEAFLLDAGVKARAVDGLKQGIVTNSDYGQGMPLMKETRERIGKLAKELDETVLIFPGFFGTDKEGNTVSLGRGGSDFSAGIIAEVLGASSLELWKDVNGFMSADPKIIEDATLVPRLSYEEAEELGYFGAKILHPKTVLPLREKGIKIVVKNIQKPEKIGTVIGREKSQHEKIVKSIAVKRNIACVTLRSPAFIGQAGVLEKIFSAIAKARISVDMVTTSEVGVSFTIDEKDLERAKKAVKTIDLAFETAEYEKGIAMIGLVGEGMKKMPGVAARAFGALGDSKVNVEMISHGSSEINISFLVKESNLDKAVKVLHKEFGG